MPHTFSSTEGEKSTGKKPWEVFVRRWKERGGRRKHSWSQTAAWRLRGGQRSMKGIHGHGKHTIISLRLIFLQLSPQQDSRSKITETGFLSSQNTTIHPRGSASHSCAHVDARARTRQGRESAGPGVQAHGSTVRGHPRYSTFKTRDVLSGRRFLQTGWSLLNFHKWRRFVYIPLE